MCSVSLRLAKASQDQAITGIAIGLLYLLTKSYFKDSACVFEVHNQFAQSCLLVLLAVLSGLNGVNEAEYVC